MYALKDEVHELKKVNVLECFTKTVCVETFMFICKQHKSVSYFLMVPLRLLTFRGIENVVKCAKARP